MRALKTRPRRALLACGLAALVPALVLVLPAPAATAAPAPGAPAATAPARAPRPASGLQAHDAPNEAGREIDLAWHASPDDSAGLHLVRSYVIERAESPGGPWTAVDSAAAGVTHKADQSPRRDVDYFYRVLTLGEEPEMKKGDKVKVEGNRVVPRGN